ncbi:hypothetical protein BFW01_g2693 [Lasiodiplodia theobromae]|uniref:uncharacterized protein n=1 Tax=Lasiodiplodia theobromae TaxID=45133 RepID=UPI0015C3F9AF|nr:uncharacterized protein LTHEOB_5589 [Lasiodiplodia theobromae]KAF4545178.1 hypothetical protein LTHEOB_5589 [Lasiodiplodia theobromae]KAF9631831.1 hypothetical protein BFW01_g2693 [Lasiodiplodia theobromae]
MTMSVSSHVRRALRHAAKKALYFAVQRAFEECAKWGVKKLRDYYAARIPENVNIPPRDQNIVAPRATPVNGIYTMDPNTEMDELEKAIGRMSL